MNRISRFQSKIHHRKTQIDLQRIRVVLSLLSLGGRRRLALFRTRSGSAAGASTLELIGMVRFCNACAQHINLEKFNLSNSLSDYVLGPSHILPTNSSSRFSSPLSVEDFLVSYSYISLNKSNDLVQYEEYVKHTINIANAEGLTAHALAAKKRLKN